MRKLVCYILYSLRCYVTAHRVDPDTYYLLLRRELAERGRRYR